MKFGVRVIYVFAPLFMGALLGCKPSRPAPAAPASHSALTTSASCRTCHAQEFEAWKATDHALANRLPGPVELAALKSFPRGEPAATPTAPVMILGNKPLWQPLVPAAGGRWQAHEIAHDPVRTDWFNVFGAEERKPGEWGHWTGRGMNWNSMCAQCHMTGYQPGYDAKTDTYHSTWIEQGVGCIQCHGAPGPDHGKSAAASAAAAGADPFHGDRNLMMQTCAPCHARNEALTRDFKSGDLYADHYRVALPVNPGTFYPDGQQRDEDFNWTSVLTSRMGHAGVTCLDCHDPHTSKTILPVANNALCLQCHAAPGRVLPGGIRAVPIDPVAHSHHGPESAGNSCVACHMPTTSYMQRSPRHDHGWLKPDPLLTKELGIPNACSRCHDDKGIDWVIAKADAWYGAKLDSRQRTRARVIAAAQSPATANPDGLLALITGEDIPAWRATYLDLMAPFAGNTPVRTVAEASLRATDPLERSAAVRLLARLPDAHASLRPLLADPVRLVRLDAALALTEELSPESASRHELDAYLALAVDQPAGLVRLGMDLANRGRLDEATAALVKASPWDPTSADLRDYLGQLNLARNRPTDAAANFAEAAQLAPADAQRAYSAALAYAQAGQTGEAEPWLRETVRRDPAFDRAWYNLGLLLAGKGEVTAALDALARAEKINGHAADYPYAAATLHWKEGRRDLAREAARRALAIDPAYAPARRLLSGP